MITREGESFTQAHSRIKKYEVNFKLVYKILKKNLTGSIILNGEKCRYFRNYWCVGWVVKYEINLINYSFGNKTINNTAHLFSLT